MKVSRIAKIGGASLLGLCAVSLGVDKANLSPVISQAAGFVGAFLGSLAAQRREHTKTRQDKPSNPANKQPSGS